MKLDISKFKKLRTEKDHTVLQHPDGHEIRVLHKPLSPAVKEQLDALPHMSKGGEDQALKSDQRTEGFNKARSRGVGIVNHQLKGAENYSKGGHVENPKLEQSHVVDRAPKMADGGPAPLPISNAGGISKGIASGFGDANRYADGGTPSPTPSPEPPQDLIPLGQGIKKAFATQFAGGGPVHHFHFYANGSPGPVQLSQEDINPNAQFQQPVNPTAAAIDQAYAEQNPTPEQSLANIAGIKESPQVESAPMTPVSDKSPEVPKDQPPITPTDPNAAPTGTLPEQFSANTERGASAELAGAQNTAKEQAAESGIMGKNAQELEDAHEQYQQVGNDLHQKYDSLAKQVEQGIDPNRWWNSKSTGGQIATAIGMMFAGAGAGVSGHPEMALEAVNKAIDRDVEAQKSDLSNKNTLLSHYMDLYKSLPQAEAATRLTYAAIAEGKIKQVATRLGSQNAVLTAQQSIAQLRNQALPHMAGLAQDQVQMNALAGMNQPSNDPASQIRKLGLSKMMSPPQQEAALKELGSSQRIDKMQEDVEEAARGLDNQLLKGKLTPSARQSSINTFAGILAKEAEGRFNLEEAKNQMEALMPSPLDSQNTSMLKAKHRQQFFDSLKVTPTLQAFGIKSGPQQSAPTATNAKGQKLMLQNGRWVPVNG